MLQRFLLWARIRGYHLTEVKDMYSVRAVVIVNAKNTKKMQNLRA